MNGTHRGRNTLLKLCFELGFVRHANVNTCEGLAL